IEEVSVVATQEYALETALDKMRREWDSLKLDVGAYKETILQLLDDQIVKTQAMRGSPFCRVWLYLEPIFGSEDIYRQMPTEGRRFQAVDGMWRKVMKAAQAVPDVLKVGEMDKLLEKFQEANKFLDLIQKGLNDYLETKRLAFPRFFFLSPDELLEILSQTKNPLAVQPHLGKCFEGIAKLSFNDKGVITEMISPESEKGSRKGNVEVWLCDVEDAMIKTLRSVFAEALTDYAVCERTTWVDKWPRYWTAEVEQALREEGANGLAEYGKVLQKQLEGIVQKVRTGSLSSAMRTTIGALVTIDVHQEMAELGIHSASAFEWLSQLRYYW
ncbi:dynein heavy chain, N-terminal region 2-domain-containing protein, partial [Pavlovales sp. CCMP2436]